MELIARALAVVLLLGVAAALAWLGVEQLRFRDEGRRVWRAERGNDDARRKRRARNEREVR